MQPPADDPDTLYRSYLRPLASSLVPPSSPTISSLLASTSSSLVPLLSQAVDWAHDEQNIDFWDARRVGREWEGARGERWEMSRGEVEGVKGARKGWGEAVKRAEEADERAGRVPWPAARPPSLKDDFLLPRHSLSALAPAPPPDYTAQLAELVGGGQGGEGKGEMEKKLVLVKPDEAMRTMDAMPDLVVALDLKLALSASDLAQLKQAREEYKARGRVGAQDSLRTREGEEERREREKYPRAASPTPGTPPLFARRLSFLPQDSPGAVNLSTAMDGLEVLPSSSPFGSGDGAKSQRAWNKEENIPSSLPISPSTLLSSLTYPVPVWSSSSNPPSELPDRLDDGGDGGEMEVERPVFPRTRSSGAGKGGGAVDFAKLVAQFEDGREVDQLESSSPSSAASRSASPVGGFLGGAIDGLLGATEGRGFEAGVLRSDETMGGKEAREAGLRLKVPRLPPIAAALPSPSIPSLAVFSPLASPSTSTAPSQPAPSTPWSLTPTTGLRSLTISLGWDVPPRAGAFDEAAGTGEDEEGEEELVRAAKEERDGRMRAFEEAVAAEEQVAGPVGWPTPRLDGQHGEEDEHEEELQPRQPDASPFGEAEEQEEERETEGATTSTLIATSASTGQDAPASLYGAGERGFVVDVDDSLSTVLDFVDPPQATPPAADSSRGVVDGSSSSPSGFIYADPTPPHSPSPSAASFVPFTSHSSPVRLPSSVSSPPRPTQPKCSLDSLVTRRPDAHNGVEKANPNPPVSSTTTALDRFLSLRGRGALVSGARQQSLVHPAPKPPAQLEPTRSSPPPGSIPFSLPPFLLTEDAAPSLRRSTPLRIIAHDAFLPLRAHHAALAAEGFEVVHRPSRFGQQRQGEDQGKVFEPHLIVNPSTAVLFIKLVDLLAGGPVVRPAELAALSSSAPPPGAPATTTVRPTPNREAVYTSLVRLSRRFDRLLLVLEEPSAAPGRVKPYAYTPPILKALSDLAGALERLDAGEEPAEGRGEGGGTVEVEVVLSKGAGHSAELVGRYCAWLERREEEREEGGGGVVRVWGEREWLTDDPGEDETALLQIPDLNEFSASLVLAVSSLGDFLSMSANDRAALFGGLFGNERINRISASLAASRALTSPHSSQSSASASPSAFNALSQIAGLASADEDEGGDDQLFTFEDAFDFDKYDAVDE
ncbi:hypothetical protein JCM8097_001745 [Rhodosporidiobolus ruineniae]